MSAFLLMGTPFLAGAAEQKPAAEAGAIVQKAEQALAKEEKHEEGLPSAAPRIKLGPFTVTNSMIVTWIVALGIIIFAQIATRNIKQVPEGAQNFWEWLVESLYSFLEDIIGARSGEEDVLVFRHDFHFHPVHAIGSV